jgi:hypothetical protein
MTVIFTGRELCKIIIFRILVLYMCLPQSIFRKMSVSFIVSYRPSVCNDYGTDFDEDLTVNLRKFLLSSFNFNVVLLLK